MESQAPPMISEIQGMPPDMSLQVFHQTFHAHSAALKLKSTFFRKFLDSEEKALRPRPQGKFTYEWVTEVDEDGSWHLISSSSPTVCITLIKFPFE